jgi:hypothetical protein
LLANHPSDRQEFTRHAIALIETIKLSTKTHKTRVILGLPQRVRIQRGKRDQNDKSIWDTRHSSGILPKETTTLTREMEKWWQKLTVVDFARVLIV